MTCTQNHKNGECVRSDCAPILSYDKGITHYSTGYCPACNGKHSKGWKEEFLELMTHQGDTGLIFNNVELASKFYPEQIVKIIESNLLDEKIRLELQEDKVYNKCNSCGQQKYSCKCNHITKDEQDKVVKVSDWSQKYKLVIYGVSGIGMIWVGFRVIKLLEDIKLLLTK